MEEPAFEGVKGTNGTLRGSPQFIVFDMRHSIFNIQSLNLSIYQYINGHPKLVLAISAGGRHVMGG